MQPERVYLKANFGQSFQIGKDVIRRAWTTYILDKEWIDSSNPNNLAIASVELPSSPNNEITFFLSDDFQAVSPESKSALALFPLGPTKTEVADVNDIPNRRMIKKINDLPLLVAVSIPDSLSNAVVDIEFQRGKTIQARRNTNANKSTYPVIYTDISVRPGDSTQVREADIVYIPSSRADELGAAKITVRR